MDVYVSQYRSFTAGRNQLGGQTVFVLENDMLWAGVEGRRAEIGPWSASESPALWHALRDNCALPSGRLHLQEASVPLVVNSATNMAADRCSNVGMKCMGQGRRVILEHVVPVVEGDVDVEVNMDLDVELEVDMDVDMDVTVDVGMVVTVEMDVEVDLEVDVIVEGEVDVDMDVIVKGEVDVDMDVIVEVEVDVDVEVDMIGEVDVDVEVDLIVEGEVDVIGEVDVDVEMDVLVKGEVDVDMDVIVEVDVDVDVEGEVDVDMDVIVEVEVDVDVEVDVIGEVDVDVEVDLIVEGEVDVIGELDVDVEMDVLVKGEVDVDMDVIVEVEVDVDMEVDVIGEVDVDVEVDLIVEGEVDVIGEVDVDVEVDLIVEGEVDVDVEVNVGVDMDVDVDSVSPSPHLTPGLSTSDVTGNVNQWNAALRPRQHGQLRQARLFIAAGPLLISMAELQLGAVSSLPKLRAGGVLGPLYHPDGISLRAEEVSLSRPQRTHSPEVRTPCTSRRNSDSPPVRPAKPRFRKGTLLISGGVGRQEELTGSATTGQSQERHVIVSFLLKRVLQSQERHVIVSFLLKRVLQSQERHVIVSLTCDSCLACGCIVPLRVAYPRRRTLPLVFTLVCKLHQLLCLNVDELSVTSWRLPETFRDELHERYSCVSVLLRHFATLGWQYYLQSRVAIRLGTRNLSYISYLYSKASFTLPRKVARYSAPTETAPLRVSFRPPPVSPPPPEQTRDRDSHESVRATRRRRYRTQLTSLSAGPPWHPTVEKPRPQTRRYPAPSLSVLFYFVLFFFPPRPPFCSNLSIVQDIEEPLQDTQAFVSRLEELESIPGGSIPNLRILESCRTTPLVGGFSRVSPVSPALASRRRSIVSSLNPHWFGSVLKTSMLGAAKISSLTHTTVYICGQAPDLVDSGHDDLATPRSDRRGRSAGTGNSLTHTSRKSVLHAHTSRQGKYRLHPCTLVFRTGPCSGKTLDREPHPQ
ncbi:hypothetical protein PR048_010899 [Dryococelus australis]|uniref:Uncharacterized protein n=1 Tax=Dryococelus australis TaxID=614101 RepID=A0ABQ9I5Y0_9NEOP|nr:hypothetical protein PR048_010899 [Dryococelus australis]